METVEIAAIVIAALLGLIVWGIKRIAADTRDTKAIATEIQKQQAVDRNDIDTLKRGHQDHEGRIRYLEHPAVRTLHGEPGHP